jgi:hypothetical protein
MSITIGSMIDPLRTNLTPPLNNTESAQAHTSLESGLPLQAHTSLEKTDADRTSAMLISCRLISTKVQT